MKTRSSQLDQRVLSQIVWDRPMSPKQASWILGNPNSPEYYWLVGRIVERLPADRVRAIIPEERLYQIFPKLRVWNKLIAEKAVSLFSERYSHAASP